MQNMTQKTKQKTQRKLLALASFLGYFGCHDFYAGNKKNGFIKLALVVSSMIFGGVSGALGYSKLGLGVEIISDLLALFNRVLVFVDAIKIVKNRYPIAVNVPYLQNVKGIIEKGFFVIPVAGEMLHVLIFSFVGLVPYFSGNQSMTVMEKTMKSFVEREAAFFAENHRAGYFEEIKYDMTPVDFGVIRFIPNQDRNEGYVQLLGGFLMDVGGCKAKTALSIVYAVKQGDGESACYMIDANNRVLSSEEKNECLAEMPEIKAICEGFEKAYSGVAEQSILD